MRKTFIKTLVELAEKDPDIWLLTGDLGFNVLEPFKERFPERFINAGIGEANMVGVATGLALRGKIVFAYSITPFITFRCFEQIRQLAYMDQHVILVGVGRGREYSNQGISHYSDGDNEVMAALPLNILVPETKDSVREDVISSYEGEGTYYLSLSRY
ncbi:hypothetical protein KY358_01865 [Candidatus Woesearchaeota archaeon]|nr:hypothetical protein [Candidatus Woesearchaeota archaeon]